MSSQAKQLTGLQRVCKLHGRVKSGSTVLAWDYANDVAVPEKELHKDRARWAASERARFALREKKHARV